MSYIRRRNILVSLFIVAIALIFKVKFVKDIHDKQITIVSTPQSTDTVLVNYYKPLFENLQQVTVFVSPNGNDSCIGTKQQPLATPSKARDVIRTIKKYNYNRKKTFAVVFLEGVYRFNQTFILDSSDAGINEYPITYKAEEGERVVFSGGLNVDNKYIKKASVELPRWNELNSVAKN